MPGAPKRDGVLPEPRWLPLSRRTILTVASSFAGLFLLLCLLRLNGFSLPLWHGLIDHAPMNEVLLGQPRVIRADDWIVVLPTIFAQRAHHPPFPVVNTLIGDGHANVLVGPSLPVLHWTALVRPQLWGYFAGGDFGLAWHWWSRALGLVFVFWLVFCLLMRGRPVISFALAIALAYAPFYQYWSLSSEPATTMMGLCFLAVAGLARAARPAAIVLCGVILAWAGGCFALGSIYPPFQVPLAWLFIFLTGGFLLRERETLRAAGRWPLRIGVALGAAAIVAAAVGLYFAEVSEPARLLAGTVYPGRRVSTGGDVTLFRLFNNLLTAAFTENRPIPFENICEGGAFYFLFPPILAVLIWRWVRSRVRPDALSLALCGYIVLLLIYALIGVPTFVARLTGLYLAQGTRAIVGPGVADNFLLAVFLAAPSDERRPGRIADSLVPAGIWCAFLVGLGLESGSLLGGRVPAVVLALGFVFGALAWLALTKNRFAAGALAVVSVATTIWFNPLVAGGSAFLVDNPLSRKILEIDRAAGGPRWVVYNHTDLATLLPAIGVRSVGGIHYLPQESLWSRVDPTKKFSWAWNRYAHVGFSLPEAGAELQMEVRGPDLLIVHLDPNSPEFWKLGVDYVLYAGDDGVALARFPGLQKLAAVGDRSIYKVLRAP